MENSQKKLEMELESLRFTDTHEWLYQEGDAVYIGVTELAINKFGHVVYIDLPLEGDEILTVVPFGEIEFIENTFDVNSPIEGEVIEVNEVLMNKLDNLPSDPYRKGWLVKVNPDDVAILSSLMSKDEYETKFDFQLCKKSRAKKVVAPKATKTVKI